MFSLEWFNLSLSSALEKVHELPGWGETWEQCSQHRQIFVQEKLNEHLQRQKVMWLINESRIEGFSVLYNMKTCVFGGKEQLICALAHSVVHWEPSEMFMALLGPRSWQVALPAAWPLLDKFICVRSGGDLLGICQEPGQSSGESFGPWHEGPCVLCWWNASLICFFGGEGSKRSWKAPQPHVTKFPSFVLGWTRQEGWGRWQRCWCKDVFLVFYFWFCHFAVLKPYSLWQVGLGGQSVSPRLNVQSKCALGLNWMCARNPGLWGFLGHVVTMFLNTSVPRGCSVIWSWLEIASLLSLPAAEGDSQKRSNCMCRALEFSHLCSQSLKHFPTSLWPFKPTPKVTRTTHYSLSVHEELFEQGFLLHSCFGYLLFCIFSFLNIHTAGFGGLKATLWTRSLFCHTSQH